MSDTGTFSTITSLAVSQPARADVVIRAMAVSYWYGEGETRTQVLFDNDLEISRGEMVIMTGPSGSGKSTLLTLIGALRRMQSGYLEVARPRPDDGRRAGQVELRKRIGFIFQQHNLFSSLTAIENVRMATALRPGTVKEMNDRSVEMLTRLGLGERIDHLPAAALGRPEAAGGDRQGPGQPPDPRAGRRADGLARRRVEQGRARPAQEHGRRARADDRPPGHARPARDRPRRPDRQHGRRPDRHQLAHPDRRTDLPGAGGERAAQGTERGHPLEAGELHDHREPAKAGETIVREGEEGDRFYVVGSGIADASIDGVFDEELCFGEAFGMISSYFKQPIRRTVKARTEMELYVLSKDDFLKALTADQSFESRVRGALMANPPKVGTTAGS